MPAELEQVTKEVVVVGGGVVGCVTALALAQANFTVVLVDKNQVGEPIELPKVRTVALSVQSLAFLADLGLDLDAIKAPFNKIKVFEPHGPYLEFDSLDLGFESLGGIFFLSELLLKLHQALIQANVLCLKGVVESVNDLESRPIVTTATHRLQASLCLIAADGKNSTLAQFAKMTKRSTDFNQQAMVANFTHERKHHQCAYQCFLQSGPIASLPLRDSQSSALVWSQDTPLHHELAGLGPEALSDLISSHFNGLLGKLSLTSRVYSFAITGHMLDNFVQGRLVVLGDAAHAIHPLAGQGLNLGLKDASALLKTLCQAKDVSAQKFQVKLNHYQRVRRADVVLMAQAMRAFYYGFGHKSLVLAKLRQYSFGTIQGHTLAKRQLMRHALGLNTGISNYG